MRGESEKQLGLLSVIHLEARVRKDHPLRRIKRWRRCRPCSGPMYSDIGRPSIPPERLLKSLLLMDAPCAPRLIAKASTPDVASNASSAGAKCGRVAPNPLPQFTPRHPPRPLVATAYNLLRIANLMPVPA